MNCSSALASSGRSRPNSGASVPSTRTGVPPDTSCASESLSECAGSVETTSVACPALAKRTASEALSDVLPTPPLPPTLKYFRPCDADIASNGASPAAAALEATRRRSRATAARRRRSSRAAVARAARARAAPAPRRGGRRRHRRAATRARPLARCVELKWCGGALGPLWRRPGAQRTPVRTRARACPPGSCRAALSAHFHPRNLGTKIHQNVLGFRPN